MKERILKFFRDDKGAVTVDWVVLCAGIVAMAVAVFTSMESGTMQLSGNVTTFLGSQDPN